MNHTWMITVPVSDNTYIKKRVLHTFESKSVALESFYVKIMEEILSRNIFNRFDTDMELECYGPSIVDAIHYRALETYDSYDITREDLSNFAFTTEENKSLQEQMRKFYEQSAERVGRT
jgi:hypothetical protein